MNSSIAGSKVHLAVDTLGHLLALHVTSAHVGDRTAVKYLAAQIQDATGDSVKLAYVDQGYTGQTAANAAAVESINLDVVKLPQAKRGFGVQKDLMAPSAITPPHIHDVNHCRPSFTVAIARS